MKSELDEETAPGVVMWTLVIAGGDEDAADRLSRYSEKGYIEATSVPQKYEYEEGKWLYYMRVDTVEELEAAYVLLAELAAREMESQS